MREIKLDENKNPYLHSKLLRKSLSKAIKSISNYPEILPKSIIQTASRVFDINEDAIVFGNGSMDLFGKIINHFGNKNYGIFKPTFWGFKHFLYLYNFKNYKEVEFSNSYSKNIQLLKSLSLNTKVLYLCNPNNPTLFYFKKEDLIKIIKNNPNCHYVIDETLLTFENFPKLSLYKYVQKFTNMSVVISLSKIFGIAGLRCGIMFTNPSLAKILKSKQFPFGINIITESFIKNNLYEFNNLSKVKAKIYTNYNYLIANPPKNFYNKIINRNSSFILIYTNKSIDIQKLKNFLDKNKIFLRYSFELNNVSDNFIRVSAGKMAVS